MDETGGQEPVKRDTARLADLPVEGLPADAPEAAYAATDQAPADPDPARTAHDPDAERGPRAVMTAYASALDARDASLALQPVRRAQPADQRRRAHLGPAGDRRVARGPAARGQ